MNKDKRIIYWIAMMGIFIPMLSIFISFDGFFSSDDLKNHNEQSREVNALISNLKEDSITLNQGFTSDTTIKNLILVKNIILRTWTEDLSYNANALFSLQPIYSRFKNQVDYAIFGKLNSKSIVEGKDGFLFSEQAIKSYFGSDFLGENKIKKNISDLHYIQQEIEKQGKFFFLVITPGKSQFYSNKLPEVSNSEKNITNYKVYKKLLENSKLNYIDYNTFLLQKQKFDKNTFFPKHGSFWSQYASIIAFDSLNDFIEAKMKIDLKDYTINYRIRPSNVPRFRDSDMEKGLNIFTSLNHLKMTYPEVKFLESTGMSKPNMLVVGDGSFWNLYDLGMLKDQFNQSRFWLNNQVVYPESENGGQLVSVKSKNLYSEIQKSDIILLVCSEQNLNNLGYGFVQEAKFTINRYQKLYETEINTIIKEMRKNRDWLLQIESKAKQRGFTLDEMLLIDAQFVYKTNHQQK